MRFTDAHGRKVVSTSTAATVGKVEQLVVDPSAGRVVALELKKTDRGELLPWADITAFGVDAVTVSGAEKIVAVPAELAPLTGKEHRLVGKRTLSSTGDELGKVKDVEFDAETGALNTLVLDHEEIPAARLVGIGSYAVVVAAG